MLVKGMAFWKSGSGAHNGQKILVSGFSFGKGARQSIISLLNGPSNAGIGLRGDTGIFWLVFLPFDKHDKS